MAHLARLSLLALLVLLLGAGPAGAQALRTPAGDLQDAASAIAGGQRVYVHPDARGALPDADARRLDARIASTGGRVYVAVLPEAAGATDLAVRLGEQVRRNGTYVVRAGDTWSAASTDLAPGTAQRLVDEAAQGRAGDVPAVLHAFVAQVASAPASGGGSDRSRGGEGGGGGLLVVLAALAGGGGLLALRSRRRRRRQEAQELEELRRVARDELDALGEDIRLLEIDVDMPGADPRAKGRYNEAVQAYTRAEERLDLARSPEDFEPIGKALEEGRWEMEAAKAHLAGRPEPERRAPCFFDPRHGPSVTDAEWAPPWGEPRLVPVCAADAVRLQEGEEPMSREVVIGGERMPYWQAPGAYAPFYAAGMFGGFGGFLPGLLFGSMLGSGFGMFGGALDAHAGDWGGGDFGGFGGGDFGGGGFGGGDF